MFLNFKHRYQIFWQNKHLPGLCMCLGMWMCWNTKNRRPKSIVNRSCTLVNNDKVRMYKEIMTNDDNLESNLLTSSLLKKTSGLHAGTR